MLSVRRAPLVSVFLGVASVGMAGIDMRLDQAGIERALVIGRAFDAERARFHRPYVIPLHDATVEQIEIVTEFRRVVLFAEDRIRHGDHMFGLRQVEDALRPWRGRLTIVTRLRFHPLNTYVIAPLFEIVIGQPAILPLDTRRTTLYAARGLHQRPGTPTAIAGAVVEADFDAASVGQAARAVRVLLDDKNVTRTMVDFVRLE